MHEDGMKIISFRSNIHPNYLILTSFLRNTLFLYTTKDVYAKENICFVYLNFRVDLPFFMRLCNSLLQTGSLPYLLNEQTFKESSGKQQ